MPVAAPELKISTPERILEAAFEAIQDFGLTRVTVEDVAGRAGVALGTLYRYFPSKDSLIIALVSREEERLLEGVRTAFLEHQDLYSAVTASVRFCIEHAREHPLLARLIGADQATFLPYVTTKAQPAIVRARETLLELLGSRVGGADLLDMEELRTIVDGTVRAVTSYIITPSDRTIDQIATTVARVLIAVVAPKGESA